MAVLVVEIHPAVHRVGDQLLAVLRPFCKAVGERVGDGAMGVFGSFSLLGGEGFSDEFSVIRGEHREWDGH